MPDLICFHHPNSLASRIFVCEYLLIAYGYWQGMAN